MSHIHNGYMPDDLLRHYFAGEKRIDAQWLNTQIRALKNSRISNLLFGISNQSDSCDYQRDSGKRQDSTEPQGGSITGRFLFLLGCNAASAFCEWYFWDSVFNERRILTVIWGVGVLLCGILAYGVCLAPAYR